MFFIRVKTDSEYKFIRQDRWNTPVRAPLQSDAMLFETAEAAVEYAERFMLVSTYYVHEIVDTEDVVKFACHYAQNSKGKWVLDAKAVKGYDVLRRGETGSPHIKGDKIMNAYQMCIANIARQIRSVPAHKRDDELNAFDYAYGISVGFCKDQNEVVFDIINFKDDTNVQGGRISTDDNYHHTVDCCSRFMALKKDSKSTGQPEPTGYTGHAKKEVHHNNQQVKEKEKSTGQQKRQIVLGRLGSKPRIAMLTDKEDGTQM